MVDGGMDGCIEIGMMEGWREGGKAGGIDGR